MATIIEFYIPKSFRGRPARIPSQRCGKVLPFRAGHTENTLTPVRPLPMPRIMFASETQQTRLLPKEIIFQPPEILNCSP
jgi:hypothetical protein